MSWDARPVPALNDLSRIIWGPRPVGDSSSSVALDAIAHSSPVAYVCHRCGSHELQVEDSAGRGHVWSYCFPRRAKATFIDDATALAIIELDEGFRFPSNVTDIHGRDVRIGMPVEVWFLSLTEDIALPMFRPRSEVTP